MSFSRSERFNQRVFGIAQVFHDETNLAPQRVPFEIAQAGQVELVDELPVNQAFQLVEVGLTRVGRPSGPGRGIFGVYHRMHHSLGNLKRDSLNSKRPEFKVRTRRVDARGSTHEGRRTRAVPRRSRHRKRSSRFRRETPEKKKQLPPINIGAKVTAEERGRECQIDRARRLFRPRPCRACVGERCRARAATVPRDSGGRPVSLATGSVPAGVQSQPGSVPAGFSPQPVQSQPVRVIGIFIGTSSRRMRLSTV